MATILFDVNALVYWCYSDSIHHSEVTAAVRRLILDNVEILACASSLNEAYYTLVHHCGFSARDARQAIYNISEIFTLAPTNTQTITKALTSDEPDYEDAVVRACAELNQADAILSYDQKAFKGSLIPKVTATDILNL